jgi:hypothetical protein
LKLISSIAFQSVQDLDFVIYITMTTSQILNPYADFATNTTNPFYLHPSETPAVVLVTPLLEGTKNFQSWILSMRVALVCKNKLGFVDGTIPIPEKQDSHYNQWLRCNNMILAWLQRSCSPNVQKSIIFFRTASAAWKDLHD